VLHGCSENGDVEHGPILEGLAGELVVHHHGERAGGGLVLSRGVGFRLHDAKGKGLPLGEDRGGDNEDGERKVSTKFHDWASISDYSTCARKTGVSVTSSVYQRVIRQLTDNQTLREGPVTQSKF
jgi:hypothetical protein